MAKSDYAEGRKKHLKEYAQRKNMPIGGSWKGKGEYDHILKFTKDKNSARSKQNKYEMVCKYNILDGVDTTKLKQKDMHSFAHHLNSSQVLCYNFFRPLIIDDSHPSNVLIELLLGEEIEVSKNAVCRFEHRPDKDEKSQFDFYIEDGETEIFFEIKYTEDGFAKEKNDEGHKAKVDDIYNKYFANQKCLNSIPTFDKFIENYQLYRNAIRITDKNKHLILLYPKNNTTVNKEATTFLENKIREEYRGNIHILHWEDIVKEGELYEKYFAE